MWFFQDPCPELTDVDDGFCNTIYFGSVEGALPLTEDEIIYSEETEKVGAIVKLGILSFFTHSIIFAGTTTGKIGKVCNLISLILAEWNLSIKVIFYHQ